MVPQEFRTGVLKPRLEVQVDDLGVAVEAGDRVAPLEAVPLAPHAQHLGAVDGVRLRGHCRGGGVLLRGPSRQMVPGSL